MRLCIFTADYRDPHHTQVNFHVDNLFGGDTCVVCMKRIGDDDKAVLARRPSQRTLADNLALPYHLARNKLKGRPTRSPFGLEKRRIKAFLADQGVEAVLCEFGDITTGVGHVVAETGLPVFGYFRGADATRRINSPKRQAAYAEVFPKLSGIIAVSQFLLDNLARHGLSHPNAHVIPSGVNTSKFVPSEKEAQLFVAVGRFVEKKRPDITIRAFAQASAEAPEARLEMLGDGPLLAECQTLVQELGVADKVIFHGAQPHDIVRARVQAAQFFVQHSVTAPSGDAEGVPMAVQEAMACGAIVISTRHAGIPEIVIEGETGFLVDEGDEAGFQRHIAHALAGEIDIDAIAANARAFADERLDNRKLIRRLEAVIEAGAQR